MKKKIPSEKEIINGVVLGSKDPAKNPPDPAEAESQEEPEEPEKPEETKPKKKTKEETEPKKKTSGIIMLIIDTHEPWDVDAPKGFFDIKQKKLAENKKLEHLVCLNKKIGNYINCIASNGISGYFPERDDLSDYNYRIQIITDFNPDKEYLDAIEKTNVKVIYFLLQY